MFPRANLLAGTLLVALAVRAAAQTPGPTTAAFDGRYAGVSMTSAHTSSFPGWKCALPRSVPLPLTIANGVVRQPWKNGWQGAVSPQGHLVMRNDIAVRFEGDIDGQGVIRGQISGPHCTTTITWQRQ